MSRRHAPATSGVVALQVMRIGGQRWARDDDLVPDDRLRRWTCCPAPHATLVASWHVGARCARWRLSTRYESASGAIDLDAAAQAVDVLPLALDACRRLLDSNGPAGVAPPTRRTGPETPPRETRLND